MRTLGLLVLLLPAVAFAQPAEPPPPDQPAPPPEQPAPPPAPTPAPGPYAPGPAPAPGPYAPGPYGQGAPTYYQPQGAQPNYAPPPPPPSLHNGMTFEANLGLGWIRASTENDSETSDVGIGGLSLGVGGWVSPKLAITARLAGVTYGEDGVNISNVFLGPSLQYWVDDHVWFGGGIGLGIIGLSGDRVDESQDTTETGFGLDFRAGYTFTAGSENSFNASLEINPGHFSEENGLGEDESLWFTGIGILLGYQHL